MKLPSRLAACRGRRRLSPPRHARLCPVTPSPAAPAAGVHSKTLWEQIKEGGWVMFPIALCSIATLYLIGDGIIRTSRKKAAPA